MQNTPPRGTEPEFVFHGMRVVFAHDHDEADDLIENMIRHTTTPRKLTLVTSDARIQTSAARRRIEVIDCDSWLMQLEHGQPMRGKGRNDGREQSNVAEDSPGQDKPSPHQQTPEDVQHWLAEFDVPDGIESAETPENKCSDGTSVGQDKGEAQERVAESPFPPGYGEDLKTDEDE